MYPCHFKETLTVLYTTNTLLNPKLYFVCCMHTVYYLMSLTLHYGVLNNDLDRDS